MQKVQHKPHTPQNSMFILKIHTHTPLNATPSESIVRDTILVKTHKNNNNNDDVVKYKTIKIKQKYTLFRNLCDLFTVVQCTV